MKLTYSGYITKYGINSVLLALQYFEAQEYYEECAEIIKQIEAQEAKTGTSLPRRCTVGSVEDELASGVGKTDQDYNNMIDKLEDYANNIIDDVLGEDI